MSNIRSRDTKPEKELRLALFAHGYRYRIHTKTLPGSPDIVLPKYRAAIFVHGCFWHQHEDCSKRYIPKTRQEYWIPKLAANIERDKRNLLHLTERGWNVFVVWECEIKRNLDQTVAKLEEELSRLLDAGNQAGEK